MLPPSAALPSSSPSPSPRLACRPRMSAPEAAVPAQCLDALAAAGACLSDVRHSTSEPAHTPVPTEQRVAVIGHPDSCRARDEPGACDALLSACCVGYAVSALSRLACACLRAAGGRGRLPMTKSCSMADAFAPSLPRSVHAAQCTPTVNVSILAIRASNRPPSNIGHSDVDPALVCPLRLASRP
jgi:hypothetical protein